MKTDLFFKQPLEMLTIYLEKNNYLGALRLAETLLENIMKNGSYSIEEVHEFLSEIKILINYLQKINQIIPALALSYQCLYVAKKYMLLTLVEEWLAINNHFLKIARKAEINDSFENLLCKKIIQSDKENSHLEILTLYLDKKKSSSPEWLDKDKKILENELILEKSSQNFNQFCETEDTINQLELQLILAQIDQRFKNIEQLPVILTNYLNEIIFPLAERLIQNKNFEFAYLLVHRFKRWVKNPHDEELLLDLMLKNAYAELIHPFYFPKRASYWYYYRQQLSQIRVIFNNIEELPPKKIYRLQSEYTQAIQELLKNMIVMGIKIFNLPENLFCILLFGSHARGELTPYSDIEGVILVMNEEDKLILNPLLCWWEFMVQALGEDNTYCQGIRFDSSFNPCQNVLTLEQLIVQCSLDVDYIQGGQALSILQPIYLYGNKTIYKNFIEKINILIKAPQNLLQSANPSTQIRLLTQTFSCLRQREFLTLHHHAPLQFILPYLAYHDQIRIFKKAWEDNAYNSNIYFLKTHFLKPLLYITMDLALAHGWIPLPSPPQVLQKLTELYPEWSAFASLLKYAYYAVNASRVRLHCHVQTQRDELSLSNICPSDLLNNYNCEALNYLRDTLLPAFIEQVEMILRKGLILIDPLFIFLKRYNVEQNLQLNSHLKGWELLAQLTVAWQLTNKIIAPYYHIFSVTERQQYISSLATINFPYQSIANISINNWGYRENERLNEDSFQKGLKAIVSDPLLLDPNNNKFLTDTIISHNKVIGSDIVCTLQYSDQSSPYILNADVVRQIIDEPTGNIQRQFPEGNHAVAAFTFICPNSEQRYVFTVKQKPSLPAMDYAVYLFKQRLYGEESCVENRLARLTVSSHHYSYSRTYPILISRCIGTLADNLKIINELKSVKHINLTKAHFTSLLIADLLLRPGDGALRNYQQLLKSDSSISSYPFLICIDNDQHFLEPFVDTPQGRKMQIRSLIFCLSQMLEELDREVLTAFCELNAHAFLYEWLSAVRKKEKEYELLFKDQNEQKKLYEEDKNRDRFTPFFLLKEGCIAQLALDFVFLQGQICAALRLNKIPTGLELLEKINPALAHYYQKVIKPELSLEQRFQEISNQAQVSISSSEALQAILGKVPHLNEILNSREFSAEDHIKELSIINPNFFSDTVILSTLSPHARAVYADFSKIVLKNDSPHLKLQKIILRTLINAEYHYENVILKNTPALDDNLLSAILSQSRELKHLDLRYCSQITESGIRDITQRLCTKLEKLYLKHNEKIINFIGSNWTLRLLSTPLIALNLRVLHLSHSSNLTSLYLQAPQLICLKINDCPKLNASLINLQTPELEYLDLTDNSWLIDEHLPTILQSAIALKQLKLKNCINIREKALWEKYPFLISIKWCDHTYYPFLIAGILNENSSLLTSNVLNSSLIKNLRSYINFQQQLLNKWLEICFNLLKDKIMKKQVLYGIGILAYSHSLFLDTLINAFKNSEEELKKILFGALMRIIQANNFLTLEQLHFILSVAFNNYCEENEQNKKLAEECLKCLFNALDLMGPQHIQVTINYLFNFIKSENTRAKENSYVALSILAVKIRNEINNEQKNFIINKLIASIPEIDLLISNRILNNLKKIKKLDKDQLNAIIKILIESIDKNVSEVSQFHLQILGELNNYYWEILQDIQNFIIEIFINMLKEKNLILRKTSILTLINLIEGEKVVDKNLLKKILMALLDNYKKNIEELIELTSKLINLIIKINFFNTEFLPPFLGELAQGIKGEKATSAIFSNIDCLLEQLNTLDDASIQLIIKHFSEGCKDKLLPIKEVSLKTIARLTSLSYNVLQHHSPFIIENLFMLAEIEDITVNIYLAQARNNIAKIFNSLDAQKLNHITEIALNFFQNENYKIKKFAIEIFSDLAFPLMSLKQNHYIEFFIGTLFNNIKKEKLEIRNLILKITTDINNLNYKFSINILNIIIKNLLFLWHEKTKKEFKEHILQTFDSIIKIVNDLEEEEFSTLMNNLIDDYTEYKSIIIIKLLRDTSKKLSLLKLDLFNLVFEILINSCQDNATLAQLSLQALNSINNISNTHFYRALPVLLNYIKNDSNNLAIASCNALTNLIIQVKIVNIEQTEAIFLTVLELTEKENIDNELQQAILNLIAHLKNLTFIHVDLFKRAFSITFKENKNKHNTKIIFSKKAAINLINEAQLLDDQKNLYNRVEQYSDISEYIVEHLKLKLSSESAYEKQVAISLTPYVINKKQTLFAKLFPILVKFTKDENWDIIKTALESILQITREVKAPEASYLEIILNSLILLGKEIRGNSKITAFMALQELALYTDKFSADNFQRLLNFLIGNYNNNHETNKLIYNVLNNFLKNVSILNSNQVHILFSVLLDKATSEVENQDTKIFSFKQFLYFIESQIQADSSTTTFLAKLLIDNFYTKEASQKEIIIKSFEKIEFIKLPLPVFIVEEIIKVLIISLKNDDLKLVAYRTFSRIWPQICFYEKINYLPLINIFTEDYKINNKKTYQIINSIIKAINDSFGDKKDFNFIQLFYALIYNKDALLPNNSLYAADSSPVRKTVIMEENINLSKSASFEEIDFILENLLFINRSIILEIDDYSKKFRFALTHNISNLDISLFENIIKKLIQACEHERWAIRQIGSGSFFEILPLLQSLPLNYLELLLNILISYSRINCGNTQKVFEEILYKIIEKLNKMDKSYIYLVLKFILTHYENINNDIKLSLAEKLVSMSQIINDFDETLRQLVFDHFIYACQDEKNRAIRENCLEILLQLISDIKALDAITTSSLLAIILNTFSDDSRTTKQLAFKILSFLITHINTTENNNFDMILQALNSAIYDESIYIKKSVLQFFSTIIQKSSSRSSKQNEIIAQSIMIACKDTNLEIKKIGYQILNEFILSNSYISINYQNLFSSFLLGNFNSKNPEEKILTFNLICQLLSLKTLKNQLLIIMKSHDSIFIHTDISLNNKSISNESNKFLSTQNRSRFYSQPKLMLDSSSQSGASPSMAKNN